MVISHNLQAMNANRQYNTVSRNLRKSTEKLSSGYKINRAADDAASLSISEKMRWQIRGLDKAENNIQDGISYVQVADGALNEIDSMLQRMNELAVQAANDTNTVEDRKALDEEVSQIKSEISRIFETTEFNTKKIWKGEVNPWIETQGFKDVPAVTFGSTYVTSKITDTNKEAVPKSEYRLTADSTGIKASWTGYNGNTYSSKTIPWPDPLSGNHTFSLKNYMDYGSFPETAGIDMKYNYNVNENSTLNDVITAINNTSVQNMVSTNQVAQAYDYAGNPINVSGVFFSPSIEYDKLLSSGASMDNWDSSYIEGTKNIYGNYSNVVNPADTTATNNFSFTFDMNNVGTVTSRVLSNSYYANVNDSNALAKDEGIWWKWNTRQDGTKYKAPIAYNTTPNNASLNAINNAAVNSSSNTGLSRTTYGGADFVQFELSSGGNRVGYLTMQVNVSSGESLASIKNRLSQIAGVDIYSNGGNASVVSYVANSSQSANTVKEPYVDREFDPSKKIDIELEIQCGATNDNNVTIAYGDMSLDYIGIKDTNVLNYKNASKAIQYIQEALDIVSNERSNFGAYQNRLEHSKNSDENVEENTQSAESRLRDTDIAAEMVNFSKENILSQVGQSMLSQANSSIQSVLNLLS